CRTAIVSPMSGCLTTKSPESFCVILVSCSYFPLSPVWINSSEHPSVIAVLVYIKRQCNPKGVANGTKSCRTSYKRPGKCLERQWPDSTGGLRRDTRQVKDGGTVRAGVRIVKEKIVQVSEAGLPLFPLACPSCRRSDTTGPLQFSKMANKSCCQRRNEPPRLAAW